MNIEEAITCLAEACWAEEPGSELKEVSLTSLAFDRFIKRFIPGVEKDEKKLAPFLLSTDFGEITVRKTK